MGSGPGAHAHAGPRAGPTSLGRYSGLGEGSQATRRRRKRLGSGRRPPASPPRPTHQNGAPEEGARMRKGAHERTGPHPLYLHDRRLPAPAPRDDARPAPPRSWPRQCSRLALRRRETCALAGSGRGVWGLREVGRSASREEGGTEKRGRGGKLSLNQTVQVPAMTLRKERKPSMFEKEAVSAEAGLSVPKPLPLAGRRGCRRCDSSAGLRGPGRACYDFCGLDVGALLR